MSNKNEVFESLLNQLRQQLTNNPYKQQCEGLAHEVLSLKNQLRDASALVAELQKDNIKKSEHISHLTGLVAELQKELEYMGNEYRRTTDYALSDAPEQSGCRKNDTQYNAWRPHYGTRQPVPDGTMVFIRYRNGEQPKTSVDAKNRLWVWDGTYSDIVEYKIDTQECGHANTVGYERASHRGLLKCVVIVGLN